MTREEVARYFRGLADRLEAHPELEVEAELRVGTVSMTRTGDAFLTHVCTGEEHFTLSVKDPTARQVEAYYEKGYRPV